MKIVWAVAPLLIVAGVLAQTPQGGANAHQLANLAKQARSSGDQPGEADYLCRAAALDVKKYGKRCEKANADLKKNLAQFQANLEMGRFEMQHKDYPGALRDLAKITFGPHKEEAQALMQQVRVVSGMGSPEQVSSLALQAANAAYSKGELDQADAFLTRVNVPSLQPAADQLRTNIRIYQDTMRQAEILARQGDFNGAAQKYQFAARIQPNGPGEPKVRLREMQGQANAQAKAQQAATDQQESNQKNTTSPMKTDDAHDVRHRAFGKVESEPKKLEKMLTQGLMDFYASHFTEASDAIGLYLQNGGKEHAGAAQFYLGATLVSLQITSNPKDKKNTEALWQQAREHFAAARQLHYKPVQSAVSPKILEQWVKTGIAQ
jgi:hypothetical protein